LKIQQPIGFVQKEKSVQTNYRWNKQGIYKRGRNKKNEINELNKNNMVQNLILKKEKKP
jgi:hypothetical protein